MAEIKPGREFVQLLRRRGLVPLLLPALVARIPDSIAATAIVILVRSPNGSYATPGCSPPCWRPATRRAPARTRSPLRSSRMPVLLAAAACYGASAGILNLGLVAYATGHGDVAWAGVLVAVWGAGSLAGGIAYGSRNWQGHVEWRAISCLALFGAALLLLIAAPRDAATEAFTWAFSVITVGMAGGNAVGGVIIQGAGTNAAFCAAGLLSPAGAGVGVLWRSRLRGASVSAGPNGPVS